MQQVGFDFFSDTLSNPTLALLLHDILVAGACRRTSWSSTRSSRFVCSRWNARTAWTCRGASSQRASLVGFELYDAGIGFVHFLIQLLDLSFPSHCHLNLLL